MALPGGDEEELEAAPRLRKRKAEEPDSSEFEPDGEEGEDEELEEEEEEEDEEGGQANEGPSRTQSLGPSADPDSHSCLVPQQQRCIGKQKPAKPRGGPAAAQLQRRTF